MADNIINARFKQRYDTEANWKSKNPILLAGEMAISSDSSSNLNNFNYKVGDGVSAWTQLPYSYSEGIVLASSGNKNKNEWIKFASIDLSNGRAWEGCSGILVFSPTEGTTVTGLLKFQFRSGNIAGTITSNNIIWLSLNDSSYTNSVCAVSTGDGKRDLYYKPMSDWDTTAIVAANIYNRKHFTLQSDEKYVESVNPITTSSIQSYAGTAATATKATKDASGNIITSTYATKTEVNDKVAKESGKGLSTNDYTDAEKKKLSGIAAGATANTGTITGIKMNGASKGTSGVVDLGTVLTGGSQTTTSSADGGSNVYTFSDKSTLTVKNGTKGSTGATGTRGSVINYGTAITGTSTTATVFSSSGLTSSLVNDLYIHTTTFNIYRCTTAGDASAAKWVYVGCLKGAKGDAGTNGTNGVTPTIKATAGSNIGTVGTPSVTASTSGTTTTFTFNNLKGEKGDKGADGINATTTAVATTSANGLMSKDMVTKLNSIATGAINAVESADEPTDQNTGDLWFEFVEEISL